MNSDRSQIWTGPINDPHAIGGSVGLYDTTLRDGEQSVGVVLDPRQKLELARAIDGLGIERIEAGFPRVSQDDWDAVELIAGAGLQAKVWGFSRAVVADAEALVELGVAASVIESPISDAKLAALGVTRESMLERIRGAVSFAAGHGITVAYFGVDGTRADPTRFHLRELVAQPARLHFDRHGRDRVEVVHQLSDAVRCVHEALRVRRRGQRNARAEIPASEVGAGLRDCSVEGKLLPVERDVRCVLHVAESTTRLCRRHLSALRVGRTGAMVLGPTAACSCRFR